MSEDVFEMSRNDGCDETEQLSSKNENKKTIAKYKILASHCFAVLTIIMVKFTYGFNIGFTTIMIPEVYKADAEIKMSLSELTWFSSYCFLPPVGAVLGGFLTQLIGCRRILIICGLLYILSGLMFHWSTNVAMLLSAQVIVGLTDGMQKGPALTFFAEISLPQYRSSLMALLSSGMIFGTFTATVLGTYLYWRTLSLINTVYPAIGLILIYFVPETPYWFASKNQYEAALRSLAWFRGWTTPESVESEMRSILSKNSAVTRASKSTERNLNLRSRKNWDLKKIRKLYLDRSFYVPLLTMIFIFAVLNFNGTWTINVFCVMVFEKINSPVEPHVATVIFTATRVLGCIVCMLVVRAVGKRKLLFITLPTAGVFLIAAATFGFLTTTSRLTSDAYRWIPTVSIYVAVLFTTFGVDKIAIILNSEIFPLHLRYVGVGTAHFVNMMFLSLMNKIFLYIVGAFTMSGALLLFAVVNIVGLVGTYFFIPETEGKSLREIEDHYAGTQSLIKIKSKVKT